MNKTHPAVSLEIGLVEDQTDCVFHELQLAFQWQRPSILFAIYNSKSIRREAESALENRILETGKTVVHFQNNEAENSGLVQFVSEITANDDTIFFIDPITDDGRKNSSEYLYKTLNSSRDQLIDRLIRVVFWLTENEAFNLARNAPDFWASRHRVIDFICQNPAEDTCHEQQAPLVRKSGPDEPASNSINILLTLGVTSWKKGDHVKAAEFLQAALAFALKTGDASRQAICWKAIALVMADAGRTEDAIKAYTQLIALVPQNITVWNNIGALYQKTGQYKNAFHAFNNAIKKNPNDPVSWNGIGNVYRSARRAREAIECYKKAVQFNSGYLNPWINLGDVYAGLNQHDQSIKAYMRAAALDAKNAAVWIGIGNVTSKTNFHQQAIDAYTKAIEYGADPETLSASLAAAYSQVGDNARAISNYQKAIEYSTVRKDKGALWSRLGDAYRRAGEYENATAAYKMSDKLAANSENGPQSAAKNDATPLARTAGTPIAPAAAEAVRPNPPAAQPDSASDPQNAGLWIRLGNTYKKIGAFEKALDAFQKASSLDADNGQLLTQIAELYEKNNDPVRALAFHQKSLDLLSSDQERADTLGSIAELHLLMKNYASALQSIETAASLDPDNESILHGLVKIHEAMDEDLLNNRPQITTPSGAVKNQVQPETASPAALADLNLDNANVLNELGNIFAKSGSYEDAIDAFKRAIELDPEFGWSYSNLAQVYSIQGRYEEALALYLKSIGLLFSDTDKAITWNRLGDVYRRTNQYQEAMQAYQNADKLKQENIIQGSDIREIDFSQPFTHFVL